MQVLGCLAQGTFYTIMPGHHIGPLGAERTAVIYCGGDDPKHRKGYYADHDQSLFFGSTKRQTWKLGLTTVDPGVGVKTLWWVIGR